MNRARRGALFGVNIVQGEVSLLLSATRRGSRWSNHGRNDEDQDPLILGLYQLQDQLNSTPDLTSMDVATFIKPFCQIVQSDDTTGPVTGMAIASLEKFLAYNLIDHTHPSAPSAIETLSDAVTHARFVGTNPASDEVVLMKILQVLHTLLLSSVGRLLTNESVCEIIQSCFRICFEMRLSELLRCYGESTLVDLIQLLFTRLAIFTEDSQEGGNTSEMDQTLVTPHQETPPPMDLPSNPSDPSLASPPESSPVDQSDSAVESHDSAVDLTNQTQEEGSEAEGKSPPAAAAAAVAGEERVKVLTPYGLPCVRELLRFLVSIISTEDGQANSDSLVAIGLNLITVVLECGSSHLCTFPGLVSLVQDNLSKYLFQLLRHDSFVLFSRALRCCCLLFHSCRSVLKLQLEIFVNRLMELITTEGSSKLVYEKRELALEAVVQLCYTPHFAAELYVNFDCGLYCSNVFENLTKTLSKNAFPTQGAIFSTHLLSLEALLAISSNLEAAGHHVTQSVGLEEGCGHKKPSKSTQIKSAGIIFSTQWIESNDATPLQQTKALSRSYDVMGEVPTVDVTEEDHDVTKPASGYQMGVRDEGGVVMVCGEEGGGGRELPSSQDLLKIRQRKKLILAATEQFNKKPKQGINFLLEQKILATPLNPSEVANFLRENPGLSKAKIGDYIGDRKNCEVLEEFVSKQSLKDVPMVDALRYFLESFRLPGESPVVERILEIFSQHWLDSNQGDGCLGEQFANYDAVHVLSYAIMMLNTDLHSSQVKKKMLLSEFIRNQRKTNNGSNFPEAFLTEVYNRIKEEEIIMPDEHSGHVKDNYLWKVMLHRSAAGPEGMFMSVADGEFDQDLFLLSWGPTVAALSYIYDHADDKTIAQKAIKGFSKCASVAAHYELKEVFDNLIISLCKFTSLLNNHESSSSLYFLLGVNPKVRQSIHTMFSLAHSYGNILREGWKDLLDCLLALFKAGLLPQHMVEVFDFLHPDGKLSLYREETPIRSDSSLLSSLYSYWSSSQDTSPTPTVASGSASGSGGVVSVQRGLSTSEGKARSAAMVCVEECHPEQLFTESKFLRPDALSELIKALVFASRGPDQHQSLGTHFDEDSAVFFMELLITVAIENRDRVSLFFQDLSSHLSRIISSSVPHHYLLERSVVSVLHLVLRLLGRREFPIIQALSSLHTLLSLPAPTKPSLCTLYRQMAHGLTDLVHTHSTTLTTTKQWLIVFTALEFSGTCISDSPTPPADAPVAEGEGLGAGLVASRRSVRSELRWRPEMEPTQFVVVGVANSFDSLGSVTVPIHEAQAFFKVCECLSFIVRSDHLITAENFTSCIRCVRHFTEVASSEAALDSDKLQTQPSKGGGRREKASSPTRQKGEAGKLGRLNETDTTYASSLLQLLDLLDALYSKVGGIFDLDTVARLESRTKQFQDEMSQDRAVQDSVEGYCPDVDGVRGEGGDGGEPQCSVMWSVAWCPLLQGMAHMCCDSRRSVRQTSITYLQRALLSHDLHNLTAQDWHACFTEVFFPMLTRLLENIQTGDRLNLEETRVRASNLLCKVFLQHLPSLSQNKESFGDLWMTILHYMDRFLHLENSDLLYEAIPESLKNMLLVMSTQGVFEQPSRHTILPRQDHTPHATPSRKLWADTWDRIDQFLPNFLSELFPDEKTQSSEDVAPSKSAEPSAAQEQEVGVAHVSPSPHEGVSVSQSPSPEPPGGSVGGSPGHSRQPSPPVGSSPGTSSTPADLEGSPSGSFPVTLHPPLPTLAHSSPTPLQNLFKDLGSPDSIPAPGDTGSVPAIRTGVMGPIPVQGPILGPPAPPYSGTVESNLVTGEPTAKVQPVQFSSVYSL